MKDIVLDTNNKSKIKYFNYLLKDYQVNFIMPADLHIIDQPIESGNTAQANAIIKAQFYHQQTSLSSLSLDSALLFIDFAEDDPIQVGAHIKSPQGTELSPQLLIDYYAALAKKHGGRLRCCWIDAIACCDESGDTLAITSKDYCSESDFFYLIDKPLAVFDEGNPMDSISIDKDSGLYIYNERRSTKTKVEKTRNNYDNFLDDTTQMIATLLNL